MPTRVKAAPQVRQLVKEIQDQFHPHLDKALVALEFVDSKPYVRDRLNLGKVSKFTKATKLWLPNDEKYDFCISVCADVWFGILNDDQRKALIDLHLSCCQVEYEPNVVEINGKKQVVKDEYGRTEYTNDIKFDDEGLPCYVKMPLDISVFAMNIKRFGVWFEGLLELKKAIEGNNEPH